MKKHLLVAIIPAIIFISCTGEKSTEDQTAIETESSSSEDLDISEIIGFESVEEITASFLESLANRDYDDYLIHVITREIEQDLASSIEKKEKSHDFIDEFGFSLKNEKESFEDLLKYLDSKGLDPSIASHEDIEIIDYEHDHYAPLELREVIIPFPYETYEVDIVITCVKFNGNWLLTSEIGL